VAAVLALLEVEILWALPAEQILVVVVEVPVAMVVLEL
jgi:hypothetical protein